LGREHTLLVSISLSQAGDLCVKYVFLLFMGFENGALSFIL